MKLSDLIFEDKEKAIKMIALINIDETKNNSKEYFISIVPDRNEYLIFASWGRNNSAQEDVDYFDDNKNTNQEKIQRFKSVKTILGNTEIKPPKVGRGYSSLIKAYNAADKLAETKEDKGYVKVWETTDI